MDRTPPYSENAERAILGSIIMDYEDALDACIRKGAVIESFYIPANKLIYENMLEMFKAGRPVEILSLSDFIRNKGKIDNIGGDLYLHKLIDDAPIKGSTEYYVDELINKHLTRKLIESCHEGMHLAYDNPDSAEQLRSKIEFNVAQMAFNMHRKDDRAPEEIIDVQFDRWGKAREVGCAGIPTGFKIFDTYFGGLLEASLYIIAGRSGTGKTTLARNVTENIAMRGIPSCIASMEQTSEQIWGSITARKARESVFKLNCGLQSTNFEALHKAKESVKSYPIHVDDNSQTLTSLWSLIRRNMSKNGTKLFVIDYLQRIKAEKKYNSDESRISDISLTLCEMAKELRISIIALSALSRNDQLRGSGQIDYDAMGIIKLRKSDEWEQDRQIVNVEFEKQRFGPTFNDEQLILVGDEQRFEEL